MPGLLSLPSELLHEIIQVCPNADHCRLRATCKTLNEHADPIVFSRLGLYLNGDSPHVTEHQIVALATRSSKACELTKNIAIYYMPDRIPASELSWPHLGHCDDLKVHLPTAISTLKNVTSFSWIIDTHDADWLVASLMRAVSHLPRLTAINITITARCRTRIPLGLFANLSKLSIVYHTRQDHTREDSEFFMSQTATTIGNSPQLRSLGVTWLSYDRSLPLSKLFAELSTKNSLRLEHLGITNMDATVDQQMLPHLMQLTSFYSLVFPGDITIARSLWTSFRLNNIKLSDVEISGIITEETMLYLSSLAGLKRLVMGQAGVPSDTLKRNFASMLFTEVLPRHVNSLQTLKILGNDQAFDHASSMSIMKCLKLKDLAVYIDGKENSMPVRRLLDTVARLPELKILRFSVINKHHSDVDLASFKPSGGLRYVEELQIDSRRCVLEWEGGCPVKYRDIVST